MARKKQETEASEAATPEVPESQTLGTISEHLVLVGFGKQKGTDAQPGYKLRLQGALPAGAVTPGNEKDPLLPKHGILKISSRNMFEGLRTVTMTGKLKITRNAAQKETPAWQTWDFRAANEPTRENAIMLLDLARANGDDVQGMVECEFTEKEAEPVDRFEAKGPELFDDDNDSDDGADDDAENDPLGAEATQAAAAEHARQSLGDGGFDQGQGANVLPGSTADHQLQAAMGRRRKVQEAASE